MGAPGHGGWQASGRDSRTYSEGGDCAETCHDHTTHGMLWLKGMIKGI